MDANRYQACFTHRRRPAYFFKIDVVANGDPTQARHKARDSFRYLYGEDPEQFDLTLRRVVVSPSYLTPPTEQLRMSL